MADGRHDAELGAWIERELDARIVRLEPFQHGGRSRQTWALDVRTAAGADLPLILRREVGGGPFSGTCITLGREAGVLRAVHAAGIPAPRVYATSDDGNTIVLERLKGTAEFVFSDVDTRTRTMGALAEIIAALHALGVDAMKTPFPRHADSAEATRANIAEFHAAYMELCARHVVIDQAHEWLERHVPEARRPVLDHGDVGPGNFMHENGRITGIIDWELSHPGDAMDDVAWLWFRTQVLQLGGAPEEFMTPYAAASGEKIDSARLRYFALAILFRCNVVTHVRQAHDPAHDDARPAELRAMLSRGLHDIQSGAGDFLPG